MRLRPFFSYYGSKWRMAPLYPRPVYDRIIEPFAGSAAYACAYANREVLLFDKDPVIVGLWKYLINADPRRIRELPDIERGVHISEYWIVQGASNGPGIRMGSFGDDPRSLWGSPLRMALARNVERIRHWRVEQASYEVIPNERATWFIDPPYQNMGKCYKYPSKDIDFPALGVWCRSRKGQVIVCEHMDADWLPFEKFHEGTSRNAGKKRKTGEKMEVTPEAIWYRTDRTDGFLKNIPRLHTAQIKFRRRTS